jgi:hypothetical protein
VNCTTRLPCSLVGSCAKCSTPCCPFAMRYDAGTAAMQGFHQLLSFAAGVDVVKEELQEAVACLRNPSKFEKLNAQMPSGILLTGPPGTGACSSRLRHVAIAAITRSAPGQTASCLNGSPPPRHSDAA